MLLILSLAFAFFSWKALAAAKEAVAASTPADTDSDCINAHHLLALSQTLSWLHLNSSSTEPAVELPVIPEKYVVSPTACIPSSLSRLFVGPVVQVAKDRQLLSKMDELLAVTPAIRTPRGVMTGRLEKRIRKCPEIKAAALSEVRSYSCKTAPHPDSCRSCANFATFNFAASCVACAAKMNSESIFCCGAAATAFASYYTQVCLDK
ncbi:hypothetical protein C2857_001072 [Epichloe festucae Fl1]|uniref:Secreted protein n=1 Tax=Epichloe festucae (strain Fl1) TaxID=877507 RepID=A0A7S9KJM4_EPIFF|nr:hypothetical protein C2857_001072 [Epichloe festucae Fl1]